MATTENGIYYPYDYNVTADVPEDMKKMAESIEKNVYKKLKDADETIKQNLVETQKDVQKNKQDISDIKEEQQTQNNNIKNLQKNDAQQDKSIEALQKENTELKEECSRLRQDLNAFPSGQAEGEYITLKDSADSRFNMFRVGGNSKQETREGYNILKEKYRQITRSLSYILDKSKLTKKMYYSLIADFSSSSTNRIYFNTIGNTITAINKGSMNIVANQKSTKEITFTAEELETLKNSEEDIIIQLYENDTNIDYSTKNFSEVMLSSSNNTKYEEYGAMPSPEYPSEIQNVEGNINVTVCNKNLNNSEMELGGFNYLTGELASSTTEMRNKEPIYLNKANKITISTNIDGIWAYFFYKKDKSTVIPGSYKNNSNFITIEVPEEAEYIMYRFNSTDLNLPIILEIGENVTDYIQNEQQVFTFPLAEGQKLMLGDYLAKDGIHHVRKQKSLENIEELSINLETSTLTKVNRFRINTLFEVGDKAKFCTHFRIIENYSLDEEHAYIDNKGNLYIFVSKNIASTVQELKTWMEEQKQGGTTLIVEYELAEEEIEQYTEEQKIANNKRIQTAKSYKNVTNIFSTDTVSPIASVNYRKDIETMLEQVQAQTNAINELLSTTKTSAILLDNLQSDLESEVM